VLATKRLSSALKMSRLHRQLQKPQVLQLSEFISEDLAYANRYRRYAIAVNAFSVMSITIVALYNNRYKFGPSWRPLLATTLFSVLLNRSIYALAASMVGAWEISGSAASKYRRHLKIFFRLGCMANTGNTPNQNFSIYRSDASLRQAAGRTKKTVNFAAEPVFMVAMAWTGAVFAFNSIQEDPAHRVSRNASWTPMKMICYVIGACTPTFFAGYLLIRLQSRYIGSLSVADSAFTNVEQFDVAETVWEDL